MCGGMVDIQFATAEIRKERKKDRKIERRNHRAKIKWPALFHRAAIIKPSWYTRCAVSAITTESRSHQVAAGVWPQHTT